MNIQTAHVTNVSSDTPIFVTMNSPDNANTPNPPSTSISPGTTEKIAVKDGTMNMFIWTNVGEDPIWEGIVPTKVKKTIGVSPESQKVMYDGMEIPRGFNPVTDPTGPGFEMIGNNPSSKLKWVYLALILILLLGVLWYTDKLPLFSQYQ